MSFDVWVAVALDVFTTHHRELSCYWTDFDQTLKVGFWDQQQQKQKQQQQSNNYNNISAIIDPIFTRLYI